MPSYHFQEIEPRWQRFWLEQKTFRTPDRSSKPKWYVLDMFPYPSGAGLHVGHPEGYTATDILVRYRRMCGYNVMHPMGWDAFGLPAEEHARKTGTHPRLTTQKNINTFRRQIQMLGFSYDWDREIDTTDPRYFRWTQWIFLELFDTWYDAVQKKGRPIAELPIPPEVTAKGENAVRAYQDSKRLAYQAEAAVNYCPAMGTVLSNEEVIDGKSEIGGHPVVRLPLRQWLLRITAYADRLLNDLDCVSWPEPIKKMQRDWIGRSEGAEVDFKIAASPPMAMGGSDTIRVFTTRPDTLFGATYMVLAPEHPLVDAITTPKQKLAVEEYKARAARKSDLERTELAKKKTGVATGAFAVNPVNNQRIPIWIADYVLISYGTGAIMAVPAHDERDFEFAKEFHLPIRPVVLPPADWLRTTTVYKALENLHQDTAGNLEGVARPGSSASLESLPQTLPVQTAQVIAKATRVWERFGKDVQKVASHLYRENCDMFAEVFTGDGTAFNSSEFDGLPTPEFKRKITAWLEGKGLGESKVNYKLRDWLFSRQRYWGEPFPILHELDEHGQPTGLVRALSSEELPLELPELEDYKPGGGDRPEPPLEKATAWLYVTRDGKRYKRETNTMPQWAGSCWYYLRYLDPQNDQAFCDPAKEKYWMPVDLYVGGAEHAVLHLLYARFWHKVLFDRGHVHTPEPFQRLVNQGMILGEVEFTGFSRTKPEWVSLELVDFDTGKEKQSGQKRYRSKLRPEQVEKIKDNFVLKDNPSIRVDGRLDDLGQMAFVGFLNVRDWVSATSEIDIETGVHEKTQEKFHVVSRLHEEETEKKGDSFVLKSAPKIRVDARAFKMSKSRGNVINPDKVVEDYGADSLRLYEMFMGPLEATKPWSMRGVEGVYRFLGRVWRMIVDDRAEEMKLAAAVQEAEPSRETSRLLHRTIQKVTEDLDAMRFNTAIAALMELTNHLTPLEARPKSVLNTFVLLLGPFAPHIAEELWRALGHAETLAYEPWPSFDPALTKAEEIEVPVQINGKLRARLMVPPDIDNAALEKMALADERVQAALQGKSVKKVIIPPKGNKLVNIVVAG